ncbi:MAG: DUF2520 domain-containing protein [Crocinitomicaceae bacterium]|nr:DUF2520 domain-containing protein [Crocinitomicaceae bacterium]
MSREINKISIIGSGNVAWHLSKHFAEANIEVSHITSRNKNTCIEICNKTDATYVASVSDLPQNQLVIICTPDDSIASICEQVHYTCPVAYTSGSIDLSKLPKRQNLGVFYPLQTFSKCYDLDLKNVPFFIEATNEKFSQCLFALASQISSTVRSANSQERSELHLSAVFVNNFTNHIIHKAQEYAESKSIDFNYLLPLLNETIRKLESDSAFNAQTGPARRRDNSTIEQHKSKLKGISKEIYNLLSKSIKNTYHD